MSTVSALSSMLWKWDGKDVSGMQESSWIYVLRTQKSGQIIIFHQPRFPWNKGISLTKPPFGVRSCEVAIIWPDKWEWTHNIFLAVWLFQLDPWRMSLTMSQLSQRLSDTTRQRCRALSISRVGLCSALPWILNSCKGLPIALHSSGSWTQYDFSW